MKIILTQNVKGLGRAGEVKESSEGYAHNFLLPKRLAIIATPEAIIRIKNEEAKTKNEASKATERALEQLHGLSREPLTFARKSERGNLSSSITRHDIEEQLKHKFHALAHLNIHVDSSPIKIIGTHQATVTWDKHKVLITIEVKTLA